MPPIDEVGFLEMGGRAEKLSSLDENGGGLLPPDEGPLKGLLLKSVGLLLGPLLGDGRAVGSMMGLFTSLLPRLGIFLALHAGAGASQLPSGRHLILGLPDKKWRGEVQ